MKVDWNLKKKSESGLKSASDVEWDTCFRWVAATAGKTEPFSGNLGEKQKQAVLTQNLFWRNPRCVSSSQLVGWSRLRCWKQGVLPEEECSSSRVWWTVLGSGFNQTFQPIAILSSGFKQRFLGSSFKQQSTMIVSDKMSSKSESEFLIVRTETQSTFKEFVAMQVFNTFSFEHFLSCYKSTLKESGWCLDHRICCKPYTAPPIGPAPTLTPAHSLLCQFIPFFSFFHASTFHIFRLNFSHFPSDFSILLSPPPPPFLRLRLSLCAESGRAAAVSV